MQSWLWEKRRKLSGLVIHTCPVFCFQGFDFRSRASLLIYLIRKRNFAYYTEFVIPGFPRVEEFYPFQEKHWFEKLHYRKVLRNRKLLLILLILVQRCQAETETQLVK